MNKKPVSYLQTDQRWKAKRYPCQGGTMSIGGGGCGPTSAAMLISTLTGKSVPPTETMAWACEHGYVYANQGTAYEYFKPQFAAYGLTCGQLNTATYLGQPHNPVRDAVIDKLHEGFYFIALMKKGLWTNGGHYVVLWDYDTKCRINDPASTRDERVNGDPDTFFSQAKIFWYVDAREYNKPSPKESDDQMTAAEILEAFKKEPQLAWEFIELANKYAATLPPSKYAMLACEKGITSGLFSDGDKDGLIDNPQAFCKRQELATVLERRGLLDK